MTVKNAAEVVAAARRAPSDPLLIRTGLGPLQHGANNEYALAARNFAYGSVINLHMTVQRGNAAYQIPAFKFDFNLADDTTTYTRLRTAIVNAPRRFDK